MLLLTWGAEPVKFALSVARVISSAGRASPLQGGCRWFEPSSTHQLDERSELIYEINVQIEPGWGQVLAALSSPSHPSHTSFLPLTGVR